MCLCLASSCVKTPWFVEITKWPNCLDGRMLLVHFSKSGRVKSYRGLTTPHLLILPISSTTIFLERWSSITQNSPMYPLDCMSARKRTTSLETGLMRTCFLPFLSALTMVLRQSARIFIFTIGSQINQYLININKKMNKEIEMRSQKGNFFLSFSYLSRHSYSIFQNNFLLSFPFIKKGDVIYIIFSIMANQPTQKSSSSKFLDTIQPFVIGGLSGMSATCIIQPIDMIKAHGGKAKIGPFSVAQQILKAEGVKGFYRGLDSALARQIFYTTTRLGIYKTITEKVKNDNKAQGKNELSFFQKAYCASFAGFIGSLVGNPADLALVRMQADSRLPEAERRNYKNVVDAFRRIVKDEGVLALWRGATPTVVRAIVLNLAMLSSYDEVKERIMSYTNSKESLSIRLYASLVSGFLSSFSSLPFDNAKTKIQKMKPNAEGVMPYKNIFDAMGKTISNEGFTKMWVGFPTFYVRIAPHVCITLILQDFLTDFVKKARGKAH